MSVSAALAPGFADPVLESQRTFRAVLTAMSYPGRIVALPDIPSQPAPLAAAAAAICLALVDYETPLWLDAAGTDAARRWLRFHCGCPMVEAPAEARFALVTAPDEAPPLSGFSPGTDEYPEASATLILQVSGLAADGDLRLRGPGIRGERRLGVAGLPPRFRDEWRANGALFPSGVDLILAAGSRLVALPRTVRVMEG